MTRAMIFHGPGAKLEMADLPEVTPGDGEVSVRVVACTLCRSDLHTYEGRRAEPTPTILGHEILGRIEAFGPSAARTDARGRPARPGDRVTWPVTVGCGRCDFCADDLPQKCRHLHKYGHQVIRSGRANGGLTEGLALVEGTAWLVVPDSISDRVAPLANCAVATVAGLIRLSGPLAGKTVAVLGAGVLGLTACAMARAAGAARVIARDPRPENLRRAAAFGATDLAEDESDPTDGRGADVVLELAGVAASVRSGLAMVRTGGQLLLAGTVAPTEPVALDPEAVVRRMLTIRGAHNYHPRDLGSALDFLAGPGRDYPFEELVIGEYSLPDTEAAFAAASAQPGRRVLVRP